MSRAATGGSTQPGPVARRRDVDQAPLHRDGALADGTPHDPFDTEELFRR